MSRLGVLCEEIGRAVRSPETFSQEKLEELCNTYNELVMETNGRLLTVVSWWREGLLSEAIMSARTYPDLVEQCHRLGLADQWPAWADVIVQASLGQVEKIDDELQDTLHSVVEQFQHLEPLIDALRRAARRGAAPIERLELLRRLCNADPQNESWFKQRISLEKHFFKHVQGAATRALESRNIQELQRLTEQVTAGEWVSNPPAGLVRGLKVSEQLLKSSIAAEEYRILSGRIHETYAAQNKVVAIELWADWLGVWERLQINPPERLARELEPALDWMRDIAARVEDERTRAILNARLEQELDSDASSAELAATIREIERTGGEPDPVLRTRYQNRRTAEDFTRRRRRLAILGSVAAFLLIAASFTALDLSRRYRTKLVQEAASQLDALMEAEPMKLDQASAYLEDLRATRPRLTTAPEIQRRSFVLTERKQRRAALVDPVRAKLNLVSYLGFSDENAWDELTELESLLAELKRLGGMKDSDSLALHVRSERDRLDAELAQFISELRRAHRQTRADLEAKAAEVEHRASQEPDSLGAAQIRRDELRAAIDELTGLAESLQRAESVSPVVQREIRKRLAEELSLTTSVRNVIRGQVREASEFLLRESQRDVLLEAIKRSAADPPQLPSLLQQYIDKFPEIGGRGGRLAEHFTDALKQAEAWDQLVMYEEVRRFLVDSPRLGLQDEAIARLDLVRRVTEAWEDPPSALLFYERYLVRTSDALDAESEFRAKLGGLAEGAREPWQTRLNEVRVPRANGTGEVYLTTADEEGLEAISDGGRVVGYRLSGVVHRLDQLTNLPELSSKTLLMVEPGIVLTVTPARHLAVFQQIRKTVLEPLGSDWDTVFLLIGEEVRSRELNPMLRAEICRQMVKLHRATSWYSDPELEVFESACEELHNTHSMNNWVWPLDQEGQAARDAANTLLSKSGPVFLRARLRMGEQWQQMSNAPKFAAGGIVWLDDEGVPVVLVDKQGGRWFWVSIAESGLQRHTVELDANGRSSDLPPPGTPLFKEISR